MSEGIITTIISAVASLIVAYATLHVQMKKDREKSTEEIKALLDKHREEYLGKISDVKDDIQSVKDDVLTINANVQQQVAIIEVKIETLSERVDKHNGIYDKTIALQQDVALHEDKIKVANHRIDDLEHKAV